MTILKAKKGDTKAELFVSEWNASHKAHRFGGRERPSSFPDIGLVAELTSPGNQVCEDVWEVRTPNKNDSFFQIWEKLSYGHSHSGASIAAKFKVLEATASTAIEKSWLRFLLKYQEECEGYYGFPHPSRNKIAFYKNRVVPAKARNKLKEKWESLCDSTIKKLPNEDFYKRAKALLKNFRENVPCSQESELPKKLKQMMQCNGLHLKI